MLSGKFHRFSRAVDVTETWETQLDRRPFVARQVGGDASPAGPLSDILLNLHNNGVSSREICQSLAQAFDAAGCNDLLRALDAIAAEADVSGASNAYHNPEHSRTVGVCWINLALIDGGLANAEGYAPLNARQFVLGCCAAFGHDIHHDGGVNETHDPRLGRQNAPFRLEAIAADFVAAQLRAQGVQPREIRAARAAILCTDVANGYRVLEAALQNPAEALNAPAFQSDFASLREPATRRVAALLRDADLLQSAGLRPRDHDRSTVAVLAERGQSDFVTKSAMAETLFDKIMHSRFLSAAAQCFRPNLERLRALNAMRRLSAEYANADLDALAQHVGAAR